MQPNALVKGRNRPVDHPEIELSLSQKNKGEFDVEIKHPKTAPPAHHQRKLEPLPGLQFSAKSLK
ncbi:MAG: hypothetical protein IPL18_13065 [Sphingomonadales bacterium]|nr:hypothetical protein [Sphingomonadales bacterium]